MYMCELLLPTYFYNYFKFIEIIYYKNIVTTEKNIIKNKFN